MKIPERIYKKERAYKYIKQVNDRMYLYEDEKYGWKECFLLTDLIQIEPSKGGGRSGITNIERIVG